MKFNPADNIQDLQYFGEFGGVTINFWFFYLHFPFGKNYVWYLWRQYGRLLFIFRHSSPSNLYLDEQWQQWRYWNSKRIRFRNGSYYTYLCCGLETTSYQVEQFMEEHMLSKNFTPRFDIKQHLLISRN
jgi:methionine-gamma-lyase